MNIERVVYFGTAPIAVPALEALAERPGCRVVAVCTQPDRPSGRRRRPTPSSVKVRARDLGIEVLDPERISDARDRLEELAPDLGVVFAYGQYLPSSVFELPKHGSINFHPSLLPEYRGASPIQSAIVDGRTESGLTVLQVSERMDAGDLLLRRRAPIGPEDTSETMTEKFGRLAAQLVPELLRGLRNEELTPEPQNGEDASECGRLSKADGAVDWREPAPVLANKVRAYQPWPGTYFPLGEAGNLKILEAGAERGEGEPGEVLDVGGEGPLVACGKGALRLKRVQPPGKTAMDGRSFLNGHPLQPGSRLEGTEAADG